MTVAIALGASLFVALTIVPLLAYWFMRGKKPGPGEVASAPNASEAEQVTRLQRGYLPLLTFSLRHPLVVLAAALVVLAGTVGATSLLKTDFLGSFGDDRALLITQTLPAGLRLDASSTAANEVETVLKSNADVKNYQATIGQPGTPNVVQYYITLTDSADPDAATANLRSDLAETKDGGDIVVQPGSAAYSNNDLTVTVSGDDAKALRGASEELLTLVKQVPQLTDVTSNLAEERPLLRVRVNQRRAAELGFTQAEIGTAVSNALQGAKAGTITLNSDTHRRLHPYARPGRLAQAGRRARAPRQPAAAADGREQGERRARQAFRRADRAGRRAVRPFRRAAGQAEGPGRPPEGGGAGAAGQGQQEGQGRQERPAAAPGPTRATR